MARAAVARLLLICGGMAWLATPASAEPVRLRSGAVYEARSIEVVGTSLRLGLELGAGQGRATFPFASVAPADLARILAMRTSSHDAAGQLTLARVALEAGRADLVREAAQRASTADAALAPEAAALVAELEARPAREALAEIELDLRLGRPLAAQTRAQALLELGVPVVPPPAEAGKARLLLTLAAAQLAAKPALPLVPGPVPPAPPAPPAAGPLAQALGHGAALETRATALRDQAGDAGLPPATREALLLEAARDLLEARRVLLALPNDAAADLTARLVRLREGLGATWLDLADLARGAGRPDLALDRVQAALVLDPESPRAWELRRWVEGDLTRGHVLLDAPLGFTSSGWFSSGSWASGSWGGFGGHGHGHGYGPYAGGFRAHGHGHVGHSHGHSHGSGSVHNTGRRR